jgi:hypothetical protein
MEVKQNPSSTRKYPSPGPQDESLLTILGQDNKEGCIASGMQWVQVPSAIAVETMQAFRVGWREEDEGCCSCLLDFSYMQFNVASVHHSVVLCEAWLYVAFDSVWGWRGLDVISSRTVGWIRGFVVNCLLRGVVCLIRVTSTSLGPSLLVRKCKHAVGSRSTARSWRWYSSLHRVSTLETNARCSVHESFFDVLFSVMDTPTARIRLQEPTLIQQGK